MAVGALVGESEIKFGIKNDGAKPYHVGMHIVAKCPGMTGTVPEFLHLFRTCPG